MPTVAIGQRFGRLIVLAGPFKYDPKHPQWRCLCDCGKETLVQSDNFARTRSCGCLRIEQLRARSTTHGLTHSREYKSWADMIARCCRPSATAYPQYGAKGVTVCRQWLHSFETFFADLGPMPSRKHTLDRIDNAKSYEPTNCRWATRKTQRINQRRTQLLTYQGVSGTLKGLAKRFGFTYSCVHQRVTTMHWSIEKALSTPQQSRKRKS